jgi:hypothetical protein
MDIVLHTAAFHDTGLRPESPIRIVCRSRLPPSGSCLGGQAREREDDADEPSRPLYTVILTQGRLIEQGCHQHKTAEDGLAIERFGHIYTLDP